VAPARKGKVKVICKLTLVAASARRASVRASLTRLGRVMARGVAGVRRGEAPVVLAVARPLPSGRYTLRLTFLDARAHRTTATVGLRM
jgi:hypothetical protein